MTFRRWSMRALLPVIWMLVLQCSLPTNALRILGLFPHPAISHFRFFEPILRGLADAGHDMTVVGLFKYENAPANYKDISMPGEILTNAIGLQVSSVRFVYVKMYYRYKAEADYYLA